MCDYSLESQKSRAARIGDELMTKDFYNFPNSLTRGLCSPDAPNVAVWLLPGTELKFRKPVRRRGLFGMLLSLWQNDSYMARFRQINLETAYRHHDAIEMDNGQVILLHELRIGQAATVLQLPVKPISAHVEPKRTVASELVL